MSTQEKKSLVNIFTDLLIFGGYLYYIFVINGVDNMPLINDLKFWARFILVMIPVIIVAKIIIHIIFAILKGIANRGELEPSMVDERDKLIELKSNRNSQWVFAFGFIMAMVVILMDYELHMMFVIIISSGVISGILGDLSKFYYYRKGI